MKSFGSNPVLPGSNNKTLKVAGAFVGMVTRVSTVMGQALPKPVPIPRGWILSTSKLQEQNYALVNPTAEQITMRDSIWEHLTMSSLPADFDRHLAVMCFANVWQARGRGLAEDINLIRWIDDNAWFKVGQWTLREWSQVKETQTTRTMPRDFRPDAIVNRIRRVSSTPAGQLPKPDSRTGIPTTSTDESPLRDESLNTFITTLHRNLSGGMKLVCLNKDSFCPIAMAHPDVREGDHLFYLPGSSYAVFLRQISSQHLDKFTVVGGSFTTTKIVTGPWGYTTLKEISIF